jgi:hypothetical protein
MIEDIIKKESCKHVAVRLIWLRSSGMVRASGCQCQSCNNPGFDHSILRDSGSLGAADEAVLNNVL